jgi:hypothetical protein
MRLFGRTRKASRSLPTYWNESVVERIQADAGVDRETARTWFNEMLVFLDMVADSREFISPPEPVDVAWHAFILHTRDYESYCRDRFGRVIHHQPTGAPDPDAYRRAYERRVAYGGDDTLAPTVWALPAGAAGGAAVSESADPDGREVGGSVQDAGPGDGGGGGFFSNLFGGGDSGGSESSSGDGGGWGGGPSCGGGSGCGGGGGGGG